MTDSLAKSRSRLEFQLEIARQLTEEFDALSAQIFSVQCGKNHATRHGGNGMINGAGDDVQLSVRADRAKQSAWG